MTFQDLLQGVLSGKFAVPQGALSTPYSDAANVRDLSRQNIAMTGQQPPIMSSGPMSGVLQPAPTPGSSPPAGPGLPPQGPQIGALAPSAGPGRDPGMAGSLAPPGGPGIPQSAQVGSPPAMGYGRAPDSIGSGRPPMGPGWNPQLDPNQPQASPQPGNGVLALNNATSMAQANPMGPDQPGDQGPAPMALQSTDESTPTPTAKPNTAKAGDPVTRAKGILAAATSGDPGTFQAALTNPSAAAQVGSQTPDSAWNERSSYDGQSVSTTTPEGKPIPLADQHAADKQKTFGQRFMGALADPDTQDLLQSIGIGLLSNPNAMRGMAQGMQLYQQLHLRREDRNQKYQEFQAEQKTRQQAADAQTQSVKQTGEYQTGELASQKTDQELRRDQNAQVAKQQALQLGLDQSRAAEQARHDRADEGNTALATKATLARLNYDMSKPETQVLPTADGSGAVLLRKYPDGRVETSPLPQGVAAGLSLVSPQVREDAKQEPLLMAKGVDALHALDETTDVANILAKDPSGIGPSYKEQIARWAAVKLGLGDSGDPIQELRALKAKGALAVEGGLKNVRGSNLVLNTVKDAVNNVDNMPPEVIKRANEARRQDALADLQSVDGFLQRRPDRAASSTWSDYVGRRGRMNTQGGAMSGVDTSGNPVGKSESIADIARIYLPK